MPRLLLLLLLLVLAIDRTRCFTATARPTTRARAIHRRRFAPSDVIESYNQALESSPLLTKSITAGIILGLADFTGQKIEKNEKLNPERILRFVVLGLALQAPWNHFYYQLLDSTIPPTSDPLSQTNLLKVMIDQFIQAPVFTVVIFFYLGFAEGGNFQSIVDEKLKPSYWKTMQDNWKLWVPATAVNIAFVNPIYRVLFLNCVFYFWSIYLSVTLNASSSEEEQQ